MTFTFQTGQTQVTVNGNTVFKDQVNDLFIKLRELDKRGPGLRNGTAIDFGWSKLILKGDEKELVIHEPDFYNNPFTDYLPQVDITLDVLTKQVSLLNHLGIPGTTAYYSHKVILSKGSLASDKIYLERSEVTQKNDSGWFIGNVDKSMDDDSPENYEACHIFELLQKRPALMEVLALPAGYLVVFAKNSIVQVFNDSGNQIWKPM